ncbi:CCA tRNA nucleotidyltransferase [Thalassobacillus sp. CUG 92003]|uniref:CCA tRNA nucleotidyltransferase n=1 Tax=Thalassobacillus sp. CUG 92003 TaxID=2736641 RepID=UPI0015E6EEF1|nr:CCA tRNA nucleotidyltransferase [Thalassobacillus sp. CUG 92003]
MNNLADAFTKASRILQHIQEAGFEAYFVGGAVRDHIIGRPIGDIDIATSATPDQIEAIFDKVIPVGKEHGTVMVRFEHESFEVTTYRVESGYEDFRHPDHVAFVKEIKDDLKRRDFTINAMAMDQAGNVIDPWKGQKDIMAKKIVAVGRAEERFREDPLRMMRALRFVSQLNYELDAATFQAIREQASLLNEIAIERIAIEFEKLHAGSGAQKALRLMRLTGVHHSLPVFSQYPDAFEYVPLLPLQSFSEIVVHYYAKGDVADLASWCKDWKQSNGVYKAAEHLWKQLVYFNDQHLDAWLVYNLHQNLFTPFSRLCEDMFKQDSKAIYSELKRIEKKLPIKTKRELAFGAEDLLAMYPDERKGPWIKQTLNELEQRVVTGALENKFQDLKEWVIKWNPPEHV